MKLYIAGPDIFAPDAEHRFRMMRHACRKAGFVPLTPADLALPANLGRRELAAWIKDSNRRMIDMADAVIANISPFRGPNMDPGTAWEIGYAEAKGLPVFLWSEATPNLEERTAGENGRDALGWMIESFGLSENLMIAVNPGSISTSFEEALRQIPR